MNSSVRTAPPTRCELRHRLFGLAVTLLICACLDHQGARGQTISGTVAGLSTGSILCLQDGTNPIPAPIGSNGVFYYSPKGLAYSITAAEYTAPSSSSQTCPVNGTGQKCPVAKGSGTLTAPTATNWPPVVISCPTAGPIPPSNWKPLVQQPLGPTGNMLLLSDGTVMIANPSQPTVWYLLSPDDKGSYVNGTFSTLHSSNCPHADFAS